VMMLIFKMLEFHVKSDFITMIKNHRESCWKHLPHLEGEVGG
jgi:hypothetical protein